MKKKVLHIVGGLSIGGIETWLLNMLRHDEVSDSCLLKDNCEIFVYAIDKSKLDLEDCFRSTGVEVFYSPRKNLFFAMVYLIYIQAKYRFDVIHSHTKYSSGLYFLIGKLLSVNKLIAHSHSASRVVKPSAIRSIYQKLMVYLISNISTHRIGVSSEAAKSLFIGHDYIVHHCGVTPSIEKKIILKELQSISHKRLVFHVGRFTKPKNHGFIMELADRLRDNEDIAFVLAGDGFNMKQYISDCKERSLNNIFFLGFRKDVKEILSQYASVLILPSLWEGLPLSVVEAQKLKVPCLVSDVVTRECDIGMVKFLPLNVDTWAQAIVDCDKSPEVQVALDDFTFDNNIDFLLNIYTNN